MNLMPPQTCFHGGAFFEAIGAEFDDVNRRHSVVNADVSSLVRSLAWREAGAHATDRLDGSHVSSDLRRGAASRHLSYAGHP